MEHDEVTIEELKQVVDELEHDMHNSSAAFRLFEIAEHLVRGYVNDFDLEYHSPEHEDSTPHESDEIEDNQEEPVISKSHPYSVLAHPGQPGPSFHDLRKDIKEWLEPTAEFETEDAAREYLLENIEEGSLLKTDWESGKVELIYQIVN